MNQPPSLLNMLLSRHTRRREFITLTATIVFAIGLSGITAIAEPKVPNEKLVLLTALGVSNPSLRTECFALARKLDFDRRFPHLLIKSILDSPPR